MGPTLIDYGHDYEIETQPREEKTWHKPIDLTAVTDSEEPTILDIGNGGVFYQARVNMIIGESESGKSWVAVAAMRQAAATGAPVVWFDFDSTPSEVAGRFRCTGGIPSNLSYYRVEDRLDHYDDELLISRLCGTALVVIDGMSDHYGLQEVNDYKSTEVTGIMRRWQRIATATRAGVVMIDHISRSAVESGAKGASGSQAKRAKVTGTSLLVKGTRPMGRGLSGWADLIIDKDRGGQLRPRSADGKKLAAFNLDASDPDQTLMKFKPYDQDGARRSESYKSDAIDQVVMDAIEEYGGPVSRADVCAMTGRRKEDVLKALKRLQHANLVVVKGPPSRVMYSMLGPVPTGSHRFPWTGPPVPGVTEYPGPVDQ